MIQTKPVGDPQQPDFLNSAIYLETNQSYEELKKNLLHIEDVLGRQSSLRSGPRTIDLDIIMFNGHIIGKDFYEMSFLPQLVQEVLPEPDH